MIPLLRHQLTPKALGTYSSLSLRRLLTEEEVMSEFLRSEFHHPEFDDYRSEFDHLVQKPNLNSSRENALRQACCFYGEDRCGGNFPRIRSGSKSS